MRKVIAVLILVGAVGYYIFHMMNVGEGTNQGKLNVSDTAVGEQLETINEKIISNYPETPEAVLGVYNELLKVGYGGAMTDEEVPAYVEVVRKVYTDGFNELNPVENQIAGFKAELTANPDVRVTASRVTSVNILQNEQGEEVEASVTVQHLMNNSVGERKYVLLKENGLWKINGWEGAQSANTEE